MDVKTKGLNAQGFITKWLFSGPRTVPYTPEIAAKDFPDQLAYEKQLRTELCKHNAPPPPVQACLGEASPLGMPWVYWYRHGGWFLDESTFYSSLTDVRCCAAVCLTADTAKAVTAVLWTYAAVTLWVNGKQTVQFTPPVYKPIAKQQFTLPLEAGENFLFLQLQNLGVRDTRTIAGLQLLNPEGVEADVPNGAPACDAAARWLDTLRAEDGRVVAENPAPCPAVLRCGEREISFDETGAAPMAQSHLVQACCQIQGAELCRLLELTEREQPGKPAPAGTTQEENRLRFLQALARQPCLQRDSSVRFSVFHVLARLAVGELHPEDPERLLYDLEMIDRRIDCADFLITGLIRLLRCYQECLPEFFLRRARTTLCGFRYWMDEEGTDGMCFWSENHTLMFYGAQLLVGDMYPEQQFASGLTGQELAEKGAKRCREWLAEAKRTGLEEFNSAGYTLVSTAALMNLVDFAPPQTLPKLPRTVSTLFCTVWLLTFFTERPSARRGAYIGMSFIPLSKACRRCWAFCTPSFQAPWRTRACGTCALPRAAMSRRRMSRRWLRRSFTGKPARETPALCWQKPHIGC